MPRISEHRFRLAGLLLWPILALALFLAGPALADRRVALVIGNSAYVHVGSLDNPRNDAADISAALEELGFEVFSGRDLDRAGMLALVERFAGAVTSSDLAMFYFAGHAFQVGGTNYLIPTDLEPSSQEAVLAQSVSVDAVTAALEKAPGLRLVFLDACRDNPLGIDASGEGLARLGTSADFLVAYATQPGAVAFDGDGRNGTFTEALLSHIHTPGQNVADMMIDVRKDVIAATGGQQIPWENSSLTRQFAFDTAPPSTTTETMLYQLAARSGQPGLMSLYLERHPDGAHVQDATEFLMASAATSEAEARSLPEDGDQTPETEDELWRLIQRTRLRRLAEYYLESFPEGDHVAEATRLLAVLPQETEVGPGRRCKQLATHPRDATDAIPGVSFDQLRSNAAAAVAACSEAVEAFPAQPYYAALLARTQIVSGHQAQAIELYQDAAARGDLRATVSLGVLTEDGVGVPKDPVKAVHLYETAAEGGSPDGAINLAVALIDGKTVPQDVPRAIDLLHQASDSGSGRATFNLGVLAQRGVAGTSDEALDLFRRAARQGEPNAHRAVAVMLDEGRGVPRDSDAAATALLRGAAEDDGSIITAIESQSDKWSPEAVRGMQARLSEAGLYPGTVDGLVGPMFLKALQRWRAGGYNEGVLGS